MTSKEREQWAKDADTIIKLGEMMNFKYGHEEAMAHEKWFGWYLH